MGKKFHLNLIEIDVRKYDVLNFQLVYQINVDYAFCSWIISKVKTDFVKLDQILSPNDKCSLSEIFPIWGIRPSEAKLADHFDVVQKYINYLNMLDSCESASAVIDFFGVSRHDVMHITIELQKEFHNDDSVEAWELLNHCEEELKLTEKQLHAFNCSRLSSNQETSFLDLRTVLENIENVKIVNEEIDEKHVYKSGPDLDMSHFNSLVSLILQGVDFKSVKEFGCLSETLQNLTVQGNINDIKEVLLWITEEGPVSWQLLQNLNLSNNDIQVMDESLQMLIGLKTLDLSYNRILLPYLHDINMSYNKIIDITDLHLKLGNVTVLNLSHNLIKCLAGLERLYSVETLDVSFNCINDISDVQKLARLPNLINLCLSDNPIHIKHRITYRFEVLKKLELQPNDQFTLDGFPITKQEVARLNKHQEEQKGILAYQEDSVCLVELAQVEPSSSIESDSIDMTLEDFETTITYTDVSMVEVQQCEKKYTKKIIADIQDVNMGDKLHVSFETDPAFEKKPQTKTVSDIQKLIKLEKDNWIVNLMDDIDNVVPKITVVSPKAEHLKTLEPRMTLRTPTANGDSEDKSSSFTDDRSSCTNESHDIYISKPIEELEIITRQKHEHPKTFLIVPNEIYHIDETIEDLIEQNAHLSFSELQSSFTVRRDGGLYVLGLNPLSEPDNYQLIEVTPKGCVISWRLFLHEIEDCVLVGNNVKIKKLGDDISREYSQLFLRESAHLFLLVKMLMELAKKPKPEYEELPKASERIFFSMNKDLPSEDFLHTIPIHCFRYNKADCPVPAVLVITDTEIFIIEIDNFNLLNINEDTLADILSKNYSCPTSLLFKEEITNIKQIIKSIFNHTFRIEFKDGLNPFGGPNTIFSFIGFNITDIEIFIEKVREKFDIVTEDENCGFIKHEAESKLIKLQGVLKIRKSHDLEKIKCFMVKLINEPHYFKSLVLTDNHLFIVEEDFVRWPPPCFVRHPPMMPPYIIRHQVNINNIYGVTVYGELYQGGFVLLLNFFIEGRPMGRGSWPLLISSFENREQIVGHIKRTWGEFYKGKSITISSLKRYKSKDIGDGKSNASCGGSSVQTLESLGSSPVEKQQKLLEEQLNDSYNIIYRSSTSCIYSKYPDKEYKCAMYITSEMLHVIISYDNSVGASQLISNNLAVLFSHSITNIIQIVSGLFEQKVRLEFGSDVGLISFITRNVKTSMKIKKAIMDALHCDYNQNDSYESNNIMITRMGKELSIVSPDDDKIDELRYSIAEYAKIKDFKEVQILNYYLAYIGNLDITRTPITVVLTTSTMYLIQEDHIHWPLPLSVDHCMPSTLNFVVQEQIQLNDIVCIQYTHVISCDLTLVYENVNNEDESGDHYLLITEPEKIGKTVNLFAETYQERDSMMRAIRAIRSDEVPVQKFEG